MKLALCAFVPVLMICLQSPAFADSQSGDGPETSADDWRIASIADRGAVLYYRAAVKQHAGDSLEALKLLKQCLRLHEGFDPSGSVVFEAVLNRAPGWGSLIQELHREFPVVGRARLAFVTEERDLVPEGLAYDSRQDSFYLSSLNRRKIVKIAATGAVSDFVPAGKYALLPVLGIRLDPDDDSVWANSWSEDTSRSELLHFGLSGELLGRYAFDDAKHGFNDLVIRKGGAVFLTDSLSNQVYRFDRAASSFSALKMHRRLTEPNGIALSDDDSQLFVADDFGVQRLDFRTGVSSEVDPGPHNTLAGADGLYWHRGRLIAIQNAIGWPRIAAFRLSKNGTRVTQTTVLEYRSPFLAGEPTTGAISGDNFYFIVNSQGENMNGDQVADPTKLEPVRIGKLRLP
jgi:hypothetical protein